MSTAVAHKSKWQSSEAVFGIPFLAAIALQLVVPFSFPRFLTPALITVGAVFIIMGVTLIVLAHREFAQHGQPTAPGIPTTNLVTSGVFSISRNPIYLGVVCLLAGVALAINLPWVLVLLLPSFVACHYVLIAPEEKYLIARFGDEYRVYKATVYRWIGHTRISRED